MSTAEERMQSAIEELEQENRLLRARNTRLEAELMQMQGRELKLQMALNTPVEPVQKPLKGSYEAVFGHLDMTPDELGNYMIELQQKAAPPAPVAQPSQQQIIAGAKALNKYTAMVCGVDKDDQWKVYGEELIKDATTVLTAAFNLKG